MVAAAGRLVLWSLWERMRDGNGYSGVDVLAMSPAGAWRDMTKGWPQHQEVRSPVFTGTAVLVAPGQIWCGTDCMGPGLGLGPGGTGFFMDPATLATSMIPEGPNSEAIPAFIWTGRAVLAVDLHTVIDDRHSRTLPGDTALWDPAASRWLRLASPPGAPAFSAGPVWTGTRLLALTDSGKLLALRR
jgi:hypothetical protein